MVACPNTPNRQLPTEARWTMQVKDVMMAIAGHVDVDTSLRDATATMKSLRLDPIPVLDDGRIVGLLAQLDILDVVSRDGVAGGMRPVRDVMTSDVLCCRPDQSVTEAAEAVDASAQADSIERLPVIDEQRRLVGLVLRSALRGPGSEPDDESVATDAIGSIDDLADFRADPVQYMSDGSFPASDPPPSPSTLGRAGGD
jgi:CBS domain-containing protein